MRFELTAPAAQSGVNSGSSESYAEGNTQLDTQTSVPLCPELARVVAVWGKLPQHVRKAIMILVDAHDLCRK